MRDRIDANMKSKKPTKRCSGCGASCYRMAECGTCYECAIAAKIKQEGRLKPEVDTGTPRCPTTPTTVKMKMVKTPKSMDHPAILTSKN